MIKLIIKDDGSNKSLTVCQDIEAKLEKINFSGGAEMESILEFIDNLENHVKKMRMDVKKIDKNKVVNI